MNEQTAALQKLEPRDLAPEPDVADATANVLNMIVRAATDPAVDVDKMERLMAMHDKIVMRQAEAEFNDAMARCQEEMTPIVADSDNKQTRSRYASYAALDRVCRPIYTKHGFSPSFDTGQGPFEHPVPEGHVRVLCRLGHRAGFTRVYHLDMPADGKGAKGGDVMTKTHAAGSAFSYGQRYMLTLIFNLAINRDDDGNGAGSKGELISAEQKEQIIAKMREADADTGAFLKYLGVTELDALPAAKFDQAVGSLDFKIRKREQEKQDG